MTAVTPFEVSVPFRATSEHADVFHRARGSLTTARRRCRPPESGVMACLLWVVCGDECEDTRVNQRSLCRCVVVRDHIV
jgi:hypothetical protein